MFFYKKKKEEDLSVVRAYNGEYKLSNIIREYLPWDAGQCMIMDDEKVLFSLYYHNSGSIAEDEKGKEWYGSNWFLFYVIEHKGKYKIKYLNLRDVEKKAEEIARSIVNNLGMYQLIEVGYRSSEYKEYIRKEKMQVIEIDEEIINKIKNLKNIDYDKYDMDYFSYKYAEENLDYFDFVNKRYFFCDEYCLEKYKPCVEVVDSIIKKCNILNLEGCNIKFFKPEETDSIMQELIDKEIEERNAIL